MDDKDEVVDEKELWDSSRIVLWCSRKEDQPNSNAMELSNAEIAALTRMEMQVFREFSRKMIESQRKLKAQLHNRIKDDEKMSVEAVLLSKRVKYEECRTFRDEMKSHFENYNVITESMMLDRYAKITLQKIRRLQSASYVKRCRQETVDRIVDEARQERECLAFEDELREAEEYEEIQRKKSQIEDKKSQRIAMMASRRFYRKQGDILLALTKIKST